ncbi:coronatine-insensitive protein 1-like protein [Tanacetum coccineum]
MEQLESSKDMENRPHESINTVFNCVIPYIQNGDDRNSVSLVCRKWYELDCMTRKHVIVHLFYSPTPSRLVQRFPFLESLTLKGLPRYFPQKNSANHITPWIREISVSFKCLKSLHIYRAYVHDSDLELLARTRGEDLRILKIFKCKGLSTDGLLHIGKYCNDLRTLCLNGNSVTEKDRKWLRELALQNTGIESLDIRRCVSNYDDEDLTLLAKSCSQSLVSLKTSQYHDLIIYYLTESSFPFVLPIAHQLRVLDLIKVSMDPDSQCFLIQRCPNLEVLYTQDDFGDMGLQVIGQFCKKLRRFKTYGFVTQMGLISVAQGCLELECLHIQLKDVGNETMECIGTHLKNLRDFRLNLTNEDSKTTLLLDNGIRATLIGCSKLERLGVSLQPGRLTDVGLGYIGKYGNNLRYLSLGYVGESDAGLAELSNGCPKLRKLEMEGCPFSKQALAAHVFNMHSLRYMWVLGVSGHTHLEMTRPNYEQVILKSLEDRLMNGDA